jgi:hypothetical protein
MLSGWILIYGSMLAIGDQGNALPTVADVEKQVLDYRRSITRGHVVLNQHTHAEGKQGEPDQKRLATIWFEDTKVRCDQVLSYPGDQWGEPSRRRPVPRGSPRQPSGHFLRFFLRLYPALMAPAREPSVF